MCLAQVYMEKEGERSRQEVVLSAVAWIEVQPDRLLLRDLLGKEKVVSGEISTVDFESGIVTLTRLDEQRTSAARHGR